MRIIQAPSRADAAYDALTQAIYDGTFAPGAFIRIEQLARTLGISITPTREALARAAARRLLVHDANRGFIVAPKLTAAEYRDLFATRLLLEEEAVRQVRDPRELAHELETHVADMRTLGPSAEALVSYAQADRAFHRALVGGSGNAFLPIAWESLHFHLHVSRLYASGGAVDAAQAVAEHQAIVDALAAEDRDAAHARLLAHVRGAEQRLRSLVTPDADDA